MLEKGQQNQKRQEGNKKCDKEGLKTACEDKVGLL